MNFSSVPYKSFVGSAARLPLAIIPKNTVMRIIQGPLRGRRWIVGSGTHGCWLGSYECDKQKKFAAAIRRGDVIYDVGANVGLYSLLASVVTGPEGHVVSFEPVPRNIKFIRTHIELNGLRNCSVLETAVAGSEGTVAFDLGPNASMGRIVTEASAGITVPTITLDRLVLSGKEPPPNVIKCDVEGAEYDVLIGGSDTLARYSPTIFLATHGADVHQRCCSLLESMRYQLTSLDCRPLGETSEVLAIRKE